MGRQQIGTALVKFLLGDLEIFFAFATTELEYTGQFARRIGQIMDFSATFTAQRNHNFSRQHLRAAALFASDADQHETATTVTEPPDETHVMKHRACVTAAILSAAAFLESSINELYKSVIDGNQKFSHLPTKLFKEIWEVADGERFPILKKYQTALVMAGKERFAKGNEFYQNAESLIKLRDVLMHYKPEWNDEGGIHQKLEQRLSNKFPLNRYFGQQSLWFPHQCLGAGCALWSVDTARDFSDNFCLRLGIDRRSA